VLEHDTIRGNRHLGTRGGARIPAITPSGEFRRSIEAGDIIGSKAHGRIRVRRTVFADRMHNGRKVER